MADVEERLQIWRLKATGRPYDIRYLCPILPSVTWHPLARPYTNLKNIPPALVATIATAKQQIMDTLTRQYGHDMIHDTDILPIVRRRIQAAHSGLSSVQLQWPSPNHHHSVTTILSSLSAATSATKLLPPLLRIIAEYTTPRRDTTTTTNNNNSGSGSASIVTPLYGTLISYPYVTFKPT
jgi:hypothetical protein